MRPDETALQEAFEAFQRHIDELGNTGREADANEAVAYVLARFAIETAMLD